MASFDQFWVQNGENEIFPEAKKLVHMAKISKIQWTDLEKWSKWPFCGQNGCFGVKMAIFWAKKGPKRGEQDFFQNFH